MTATEAYLRGQAAVLVGEVVDACFRRQREPRSSEYRCGMRDMMLVRALGGRLACPYAAGTAQADAWRAGLDEGNALWTAQVNREPDLPLRFRGGARGAP